MQPIIWIDGTIGAGKSTLVEQLGKALDYRIFPEPVARKSHLELFYSDPKRYAFGFQMEMMRKRWDIHRLAMLECRCATVNGCLLDRGLPGDRVFANLHYQTGNIHQYEWETYENLYNEFMSVPNLQPTLLIYLDVSPEAAYRRIHTRGRSSEDRISLWYLADLQKAYRKLLDELQAGLHAWSNGLQVLEIPWSADNQPIQPIINQVKSILYGTSYQKDRVGGQPSLVA